MVDVIKDEPPECRCILCAYHQAQADRQRDKNEARRRLLDAEEIEQRKESDEHQPK